MALTVALAASLVLGGCAKRAPVAPVPVAPPVSGPYRVQPGDVIDVKFPYHPTETQRLIVRPDGTIALGVTGDLKVEGLTLPEMEDLIRERSSRYLRDPVVSVTVTESGARAYIGGEVTNEGFVSLARPMTVLQGIVERGGFQPGADLAEIRIISRATGEEVIQTLNLEDDGDGERPLAGTLLAPNDIVYVPKTGIAKANKWVDQWINGLTPDILRSFRTPAL